ncbi:DUF4123 domain-containing protein [Pseudomonas sp. AFG_SD02_1510_Pfu_092]|uniref:DUF4123 domain-containing protein n=1 Tax=Pseudomonas sp. AFG_SD02_1510_Pfu_092 TaxID=2259497 RepID=UPI000DEF01B2|nr:DUF4123 domain-containing protein [Pseudomonas sp. AFG_SD02_1510_Pfu_092]RCL21388.1 DUF4123 domain-containing protein [Pseudomonas sp. AFG_SD02_1510_Pfu_092]
MSLHQQLCEGGLCTGVVSASLFVLAEASANPGLLGRLEFHSIQHQCLWHLEHHTGLEKHAPLLFQLTAGSDLDTWLGGLEGTFVYTVAEAALPLEALARHLRRFGKVEEGRRRYLLRLGDPRSFSLYVGSLTHQPDTLARLFDHGRIRRLYFHDSRSGLALAAQPLFEQSEHGTERDGCVAWLPLRKGASA